MWDLERFVLALQVNYEDALRQKTNALDVVYLPTATGTGSKRDVHAIWFGRPGEGPCLSGPSGPGTVAFGMLRGG